MTAEEVLADILKRGAWKNGAGRYDGDAPFSTPAEDAASILAALAAAGFVVVPREATDRQMRALRELYFASVREGAGCTKGGDLKEPWTEDERTAAVWLPEDWAAHDPEGMSEFMRMHRELREFCAQLPPIEEE